VGAKHLVDEQDLLAVVPVEDDIWMPDEWRRFPDGMPQPDWERLIHEERGRH